MLKQIYIQQLYMLGWCIAGVQILVSSGSAILIGLKFPVFSSLVNLGPYIGMLGFMLADPNREIEHLAWGLLIGTTGSFAFYLYSLRKQILLHWRDFAWSEIRLIVLHAPYTLVAMWCFTAFTVIDSYWAPRGGPGVLATLGYSQRLMIALGNIAVVGPFAVFAPRFSELVAEGNRFEFDKLFNKLIIITFIISFSLALVFYINGDSIVRLIFLRGVFNKEDASKVAVVLQYCLPGMICMLLSTIYFRILFCFTDIQLKAAIIGILWVVLYFSLGGMLIHLSAKGLAIAYSITWIICFTCIVIMVNITKREQLTDYFKNKKF